MKTADGSLLAGRAAEVREIDRRTIHEVGIPGRTLMELAGAATARLVIERQGCARRTLVVCGPGNNGGDGFVIARYLKDAGWREVTCLLLSDAEKLPEDAATNHHLWVRFGGAVVTMRGDDHNSVQWQGLVNEAEVVVDAMFGTGLTRPCQGAIADLLDGINDSGAFKVAVDVPTGLQCDTGQLHPHHLRADLTTTYGMSKVGLHQWPGRGAAGEIQVVQIGWPRSICDAVGVAAEIVTEPAAALLLPKRPADGHKGRFGHVGVVGGAPGTEGAAVLSALGAMRVGAGLVTWNRPSFGEGSGAEQIMRPPELMVHELHPIPTDEAEVAHGSSTLDQRSKVLVVGPGLGTGPQAHALLAACLDSGRELVLDADALNMVAERREDTPRDLGADTIVTPHPAEAGRLLGVSTASVQADRLGALDALVRLFGCIVVLKGAASLVGGAGRRTAVVEGAEPGLSVAGSGDVLAGVIAGLLGQGLCAYDAARLGVYLHGQAGRLAGLAGHGRGALASDIADSVQHACGHLAAAAPWWEA